MANNDVVLTNLPEAFGLGAGDLVFGVKDPTGVPQTVKMNGNNFFGNVTVNANFTSSLYANNFYLRNVPSTPGSSLDAVAGGKFWYDTNYLYIAVANNTIKRVALSSF